MVGWHHWFNGHEFEQTLGDGERQENLVCCSPWAHKESHTNEWLNNNNNIPLHAYTPLCFSIHEHVGCSYLLVIVNNAAMNMSMQISVWDPVFNSFEYLEVELLDHMIILFNILRNCHTVFHSDCTILLWLVSIFKLVSENVINSCLKEHIYSNAQTVATHPKVSKSIQQAIKINYGYCRSTIQPSFNLSSSLREFSFYSVTLLSSTVSRASGETNLSSRNGCDWSQENIALVRS